MRISYTSQKSDRTKLWQLDRLHGYDYETWLHISNCSSIEVCGVSSQFLNGYGCEK